MAQTTNTRVQVTIELGHTACIRKKLTAEGFTHDWSVFVRGPDGSKIQHFIEKVVFNLHDTFNKPKRTVKEPPYQVSESGYASFLLPIDIYFRNKELPKKISFKYDLYLNAEGGPPINHTRCEKLTFQNPTEEFRQKLLKAGGQVHYGNSSQQSFDIFGTPITPDTGNKRPAGTSSSGKDKSSKGKSGSKPSTPQSHMSTTVSSSSSSSSGPATQPIASKEPKSSKSSSSSSSSTRETIGQKRPSVSSPEQTSGKKMKRSSSTTSNTESSTKHKSHKSSKKKSESDKSEKRKSSSWKHHKEKSEHKEKKKKDKSESSHSKSSSSLSKSMPELKLKNELLSPLHDSPPRSLSPPRSKPDLLDSNSDSNSNSSHKRLDLSPKDSPISSLSAEDTDEMTRKILEGKGEDDLSSSSSKSDMGRNSVKPLSSSESDSDDDIRSNHSETKSQRLSSMSPKVSKNSSMEHKSSPVKTDSKSSPLKPESKSSKSKHSSSKKSSSKSEPKSKDSKDKKDKTEGSSSRHSRANKDKREKKEKENGQCENGVPEKAPNGENIKELLDLQVILRGMTDRRKLQHVVNLIGPTGLFKVSETYFSFDLCNIESDIVQKIKSAISESLS